MTQFNRIKPVLLAVLIVVGLHMQARMETVLHPYSSACSDCATLAPMPAVQQIADDPDLPSATDL